MENGGRQNEPAIAASALQSDRAGKASSRVLQETPHSLPTRVPVEFQMPSKDDRCEAVKARSRDISEGGVFVLCKTLPALGANMELIIRLPAAQGATAPLELEMTGEVIRLETPPGRENQWDLRFAPDERFFAARVEEERLGRKVMVQADDKQL